jgi:hypothetical protein
MAAFYPIHMAALALGLLALQVDPGLVPGALAP